MCGVSVGILRLFSILEIEVIVAPGDGNDRMSPCEWLIYIADIFKNICV